MPTVMPESLRAQLTRMRRSPEDFVVLRKSRCRFCGVKNKNGVALGHPKNPTNAGTFCVSDHGWLHFDSVKIPPVSRPQIANREQRAA